MERTVAQSSNAELDRLWSTRMAAAQGGDRVAYEALLRDCVGQIKRVARRTGVRPESVDDVVQDVLLTIHRARHTYDPSLSFVAWLNAIAQRRAIDVLRRRGRQTSREVFDEARYEAHAASGDSPEDAWETERRGTELRGAVETLPQGQREAVEALAIRQLSLAEAALETGKTKGALKVNLHRALKALRDRFDKAD